MKKSLLVGSLMAAAVVIAPTAASAGTWASIWNTGPRSVNRIRVWGSGQGRVRIQNNNNVNGSVGTTQDAETGDAKVKHNTDAGDAQSGGADNTSGVYADVIVENNNDGGGCCGSSDVDVEIDTTGPRSRNIVRVGGLRGVGTFIKNNNNLNVNVETDQDATSGDAKVKGNTNGGDATSGDASNWSETEVLADVVNDNSAAQGCGCDDGGTTVSIGTTGPKSTNVVTVGGGSGGTSVQNNNNLNVSSSTSQSASTGNATVQGNTNGGSATSGSASNSSYTGISFSVSNN